MTDLTERRALLSELREKHLAFAREQLSSETSKKLLRDNVAAAIEAWLSAKVSDVFDVATLSRAVETALSDQMLRDVVRPVMKTSALLEVARLREDAAKLGTYVPESARSDVTTLLGRPKLISEKLIRKLLAHEALEDVMREVLEGALRDFQDKVNPFTSDWGLPAIFKKLSPMGLGLGFGPIAKSFEGVQREFEKRLEPERKRFLQGAAKRALSMTADFMVERGDQPTFVAFRREIFAWLLDQPTSELFASADETTSRLAESAGAAVTRHVLGMEATKRRRRATIEMALAAHKNQSLREALAAYGVSPSVEADAIADVIWRPLQLALATPAANAFFESIIGGFYDRELASLGEPGG